MSRQSLARPILARDKYDFSPDGSGDSLDARFILQDKYRRAVLEDLSNGERGGDAIAKRNHLPAPGVARAVRELRAEELVGGPEEELYLTEQGKEVFAQMLELDKAGVTAGEAGTGSDAHTELRPKDSRTRTENQGN